MAQFDSLIIFPLIWSLLLVLVLYYNLSINMLIPDYFGTKKFREKKLNSPSFYNSSLKNPTTNQKHSYLNSL